MARPPKKPEDRRTESIRIPLTEAEKLALVSAAEKKDAKPVSWAHDVLVRASKRANAK